MITHAKVSRPLTSHPYNAGRESYNRIFTGQATVHFARMRPAARHHPCVALLVRQIVFFCSMGSFDIPGSHCAAHLAGVTFILAKLWQAVPL